MRDLSLHILDLVQNSVKAGASLVQVRIRDSAGDDAVVIEIADDGCGMDADLLARVTSPFTTTRTTRRVGLGIPMFKANAEGSGGSFSIDSRVGEGTRVKGVFGRSNIDRPPMGDLQGPMLTLVLGTPEYPDYLLLYETDDTSFTFDTREVRRALDGLPLDLPEVVSWMRDYLREGFEQISGGATL